MSMAPLQKRPEHREAAHGRAPAGPAATALQRRAQQGTGAVAASRYAALLAGRATVGDGVPAQLVRKYNHERRLYVNDEDDTPVPDGYQRVGPNVAWNQPPWTSVPPGHTRIGTDTFDDLRNYFTGVGLNHWNTPVATVGGIYTEAMSTCTTIGFRGWDNGQLYSALYHNTGTHQTPQQIRDNIFTPLRQQFNGQHGLPVYAALENVDWFAIGGAPFSAMTCASINQAFQDYMNEDWQSTLFTPSPDELVKNAMVDSAGNIVYALEQPQQ